MLFIVHREQILQKAKEDYQRLLGGLNKDYGILSGTTKQYDAKYLFTTIKTIANQDSLSKFHTDDFAYMLIDEVHIAGVSSDLRVVDKSNSHFLLGMTATSARTDIFKI